MYTPYAQAQIHIEERKAREEDLRVSGEGGGVYTVLEKTRTSETRHKVNLKTHTCDCYVKVALQIPCKHLIAAADKYDMRDTALKDRLFRKNNGL